MRGLRVWVVYKITTGEFILLFSFDESGAGGATPIAGLVRDSAGHLYGTAADGGMAYDACPFGYAGASLGCGVVFRLDPYGNEKIVYRFHGTDGANPYGGVILDSAGNMYGTTYMGGNANGGVVYKLTPPKPRRRALAPDTRDSGHPGWRAGSRA